MKTARVLGRAGFTLIEILVTLILVSLLVAAVFPVAIQQLGRADAPRMANDLISIKSGIETFNANMRQGYPGDLEDLALKPVYGTDKTVAGGDFLNNQTQIDARWNGPYADFIATVSSTASGALFETGFSSFVDYDLICFNPASTANDGAGVSTCATGDFVTVLVNQMTQADFDKVNELFDGSSETTASARHDGGKFRCKTSGTTHCTPAYYLAVPFRS